MVKCWLQRKFVHYQHILVYTISTLPLRVLGTLCKIFWHCCNQVWCLSRYWRYASFVQSHVDMLPYCLNHYCNPVPLTWHLHRFHLWICSLLQLSIRLLSQVLLKFSLDHSAVFLVLSLLSICLLRHDFILSLGLLNPRFEFQRSGGHRQRSHTKSYRVF